MTRPVSEHDQPHIRSPFETAAPTSRLRGRGGDGLHRLPPCWCGSSAYQVGPPSTRIGSFSSKRGPGRMCRVARSALPLQNGENRPKAMSISVDRPHHAHAASPAHDHAPHGGVGPLALGALGVVYGDIGTSPLYAMDQIFRVAPARTAEDALGAVSLVDLDADRHRRDQIRAAGAARAERRRGRRVRALRPAARPRRPPRPPAAVGADGGRRPPDRRRHDHAGDQRACRRSRGSTSPRRASPRRSIPITLGLLTGLFAIQSQGASGVGSVFGPIVLVWFVSHRRARRCRRSRPIRKFSPPSIRSTGFAFLGARDLIEALLHPRRA